MKIKILLILISMILLISGTILIYQIKLNNLKDEIKEYEINESVYEFLWSQEARIRVNEYVEGYKQTYKKCYE